MVDRFSTRKLAGFWNHTESAMSYLGTAFLTAFVTSAWWIWLYHRVRTREAEAYIKQLRDVHRSADRHADKLRADLDTASKANDQLSRDLHAAEARYTRFRSAVLAVVDGE